MKPVIIAIIIVFLVVAIGALIVTPEKEIVSDIDEPTINPILEQEEAIPTSTIIEQKELTSSTTKENCDPSYPEPFLPWSCALPALLHCSTSSGTARQAWTTGCGAVRTRTPTSRPGTW